MIRRSFLAKVLASATIAIAFSTGLAPAISRFGRKFQIRYMMPDRRDGKPWKGNVGWVGIDAVGIRPGKTCKESFHDICPEDYEVSIEGNEVVIDITTDSDELLMCCGPWVSGPNEDPGKTEIRKLPPQLNAEYYGIDCLWMAKSRIFTGPGVHRTNPQELKF